MTAKRQVYLLDPQQIPPETIAVTFAKTSRSPQSFREIAAGLTDEKSAEFHEKWVVGYGHASVAEHAVLHVAVDNISRLAVEVLESNRLASYTEKSTRYQKWDADAFQIPPELDGSPLRDKFIQTCRMLFETYRQSLPAVQAEFGVARADAKHLPYPDAAFDRVLSSLLLHHLGRARLERQRAGYGDELLVGHGKRLDARVEVYAHADARQHVGRQAPHLAVVDQLAAGRQLRADGDVLGHRQVGKKGEVLEDDLDAAGHGQARVERRMLDAVDRCGAAIRPFRSRQDLDERGLAAAVLAGEADRLALVDVEADARQRLHAREGLGDVADADEGLVCDVAPPRRNGAAGVLRTPGGVAGRRCRHVCNQNG